MERRFELERYLSDGVHALVRDMLKASFISPKGSAFFARYALTADKAQRRRHAMEENGDHIPSFLIASITGRCNLNCAGCYDRANHACASQAELSAENWGRIFAQAEELGVSAILLAGGEPLMRRDVIEEAARHPALLFPVFTNGILLSGSLLALFEKHRNLIPIISMEGDEGPTDARRGEGVYGSVITAMSALARRNLLFGASITVTAENIRAVTDDAFLTGLNEKGCRACVFVEYVPVENPALAPSESQRADLARRVSRLRERENMIIISFPGDEKESGGCLAAGRGFFHINASGGAEPCPFSPYSDTSLKTTSLRDALKSPLFTKLKDSGALLEEHTGGCTLFAQAETVRSLAENA